MKREIYDEDHEAFRASVKQFLDREVVPHLETYAERHGLEPSPTDRLHLHSSRLQSKRSPVRRRAPSRSNRSLSPWRLWQRR